MRENHVDLPRNVHFNRTPGLVLWHRPSLYGETVSMAIAGGAPLRRKRGFTSAPLLLGQGSLLWVTSLR